MTKASKSSFEVLPWDVDANRVALRYRSSLGDFTEIIDFPAPLEVTTPISALLDLLALVSSVSYAKAIAPVPIEAPTYGITTQSHTMLETLYDQGMREFAFHNALPLENTFSLEHHTRITRQAASPSVIDKNSSLLIPVGGGRDSGVVTTALQYLRPQLLSIGHNRYTEKIASEMSLPLQTITRTIDPLLLQLNSRNALNGHVPVTAINSLLAVVCAEMNQCVGVVMANEASSSEPTRIVNEILINHQYSKSLAFESLLRSALASTGIATNYFSALRDRTDDEIARTFASNCSLLHTSFMSCNQAMLRDESRRSDGWCRQCPKCRSVYLSLAPYLSPSEMTEIFGADLLNDATQRDGFIQLVDAKNKPFECVGEIATAIDCLHQLQQSPLWKNHVVVKNIDAPDRIARNQPQAIEHFIPGPIHDILEEFFRS